MRLDRNQFPLHSLLPDMDLQHVHRLRDTLYVRSGHVLQDAEESCGHARVGLCAPASS
jgi:hypothetical protein